VRRRARHARLLIGFWGQRRDALADTDAAVTTIADAVATSLAEAIAEIEAVVPDPAPALARQSA
jgi:hypothetical protein